MRFGGAGRAIPLLRLFTLEQRWYLQEPHHSFYTLYSTHFPQFSSAENSRLNSSISTASQRCPALLLFYMNSGKFILKLLS